MRRGPSARIRPPRPRRAGHRPSTKEPPMRPMLFLRAAVVLAAGLPPASVLCAATPEPAASAAFLVTISIRGLPARDAVAYFEQLSGLTLAPLWRDAEHTEGLDPDRIIDLECRAVTPAR